VGTFLPAVSLAPGNSVIAHANLAATAASSSVLRSPFSSTETNASIVLLSPTVERVAIRTRCTSLITVTTSPIVNVYRLYYATGNSTKISVGDTTIPNDGSVLFRRVIGGLSLDTNITLTTATTSDSDVTYRYGTTENTMFFKDDVGYGSSSADGALSSYLQTYSAFGLLVLTATAFSGTAATIQAQLVAV